MMSDEQLQELQQRNMQRVKDAIEKLGNKYLCHPDNRVKRKTPTNRNQNDK